MLPDKEQAMALLEAGFKRNPGPWKNHSIITAKCAAEIASHCSGMDTDKAYILGLLHDIGRREGVTYLVHVIDGYDYLMRFSYTEAARICLTHSFAIKDIKTYIGKNDVSPAQYDRIDTLIHEYEYDDYDLLIQLCDALALPDRAVGIEDRMNDVKRRYGYYPENKWHKLIALKRYFEDKSGLNIDRLDIKL